MYWLTSRLHINDLIQVRQKVFWLIGMLFVVVIVLEYSTPPPYVFGYLYIGAVLLASARLGRRATYLITLMTVLLTLFNLVIPGRVPITAIAVVNRLITVLALMVTGWLSDRIQRYEEAINRQQLQLIAQEKMAEMREDFVSTLAHDLKTPLLGALETLRALRDQQFGAITLPQKNVFDVMTRSHKKTLDLVNTLMDVYRYDTEGLYLNCQVINLVKLVEEAIVDVTHLASPRQIGIALTLEGHGIDKGCWVYGDPLQLQRVLTNLLTNAVNHSLRAGQVNVSLTTGHRDQQIEVKDEGQGIQPQDLPYLFERFYQGSGDRQAKGAGLGLYLSRQIVEAHGGKIWAVPRSPRGSIFAFRLPAHKIVSSSLLGQSHG